MEYACAELLSNISGDDSKWRTVVDFLIRSVYYNGTKLYFFFQLRVKGKSKMRKRRSRTLYMLLTPTIKDVTMTLILLWSNTLFLEFRKMQELRLEPQRSNDSCIKEFSLEV